MRYIYTLIFCFSLSVSAFCQLTAGAEWTNAFQEMSPGQRVERYQFFGLMVKKPLGLSFNVGTGVAYKNLDARMIDYINDSDFAPYFRVKNPSKTLPLNRYFNKTNSYSFHFVDVPLSIEFKVVPGFRMRYMYHVNWLVKTNEDVDQYLENGKESAASLSGNHDFALMFMNAASQAHLVIGVVTQPQLLNKNQIYTYQFTQDFYKKFGSALAFYVGISIEGNAVKRKRKNL
jgi:hypothetical protein